MKSLYLKNTDFYRNPDQTAIRAALEISEPNIQLSAAMMQNFYNRLTGKFGVSGLTLTTDSSTNALIIKYSGACSELDLPYFNIEMTSSYVYNIPPSIYTMNIDGECLF